MTTRLPGLWPGDIVRDPDGKRYMVGARGIRGGERYIMLVTMDRRHDVVLMPMSNESDCGHYTLETP